MCSIPAQGHNKNEDVISNGLFRQVLEAKSRMSSTSSSSSSDSQTNASDPPAVRSADEGMHTGTLKRRAKTEKAISQTPS